jgi:hypothetical protein
MASSLQQEAIWQATSWDILFMSCMRSQDIIITAALNQNVTTTHAWSPKMLSDARLCATKRKVSLPRVGACWTHAKEGYAAKFKSASEQRALALKLYGQRAVKVNS